MKTGVFSRRSIISVKGSKGTSFGVCTPIFFLSKMSDCEEFFLGNVQIQKYVQVWCNKIENYTIKRRRLLNKGSFKMIPLTLIVSLTVITNCRDRTVIISKWAYLSESPVSKGGRTFHMEVAILPSFPINLDLEVGFCVNGPSVLIKNYTSETAK